MYDEIEKVYKDKSGKYVFWDKRKSYVAAISNELYMNVSMLLFELTNEEKYLKNALNTYEWLFFESNLVAIDDRNKIKAITDGFSIKDNENIHIGDKWSYN